MALGRRSFERKFKQATNNTVQEYIQRIKVEVAKSRFERSSKNINQMMFDVGYTYTKAFNPLLREFPVLHLLSTEKNIISRILVDIIKHSYQFNLFLTVF